MEASRSWAWITSASWTLIGMLLVVIVNAKPFGCPPSASFAFDFARSRRIGGIDRSYAQLVGGVGPLAGPPPLSHTPLTICPRASAHATPRPHAFTVNGAPPGFHRQGKTAT